MGLLFASLAGSSLTSRWSSPSLDIPLDRCHWLFPAKILLDRVRVREVGKGVNGSREAAKCRLVLLTTGEGGSCVEKSSDMLTSKSVFGSCAIIATSFSIDHDPQSNRRASGGLVIILPSHSPFSSHEEPHQSPLRIIKIHWHAKSHAARSIAGIPKAHRFPSANRNETKQKKKPSSHRRRPHSHQIRLAPSPLRRHPDPRQDTGSYLLALSTLSLYMHSRTRPSILDPRVCTTGTYVQYCKKCQGIDTSMGISIFNSFDEARDEAQRSSTAAAV